MENNKEPEFIIDSLRENLQESFELDQIVMSDALMERTLKAIHENEQPHISDTIEQDKKGKKRKILYFSKSVALLAASLFLFVVGVEMMGSINTAKNSKYEKSENEDLTFGVEAESAAEELPEENIIEQGEDTLDKMQSNFSFGDVCLIPEKEIIAVEVARDGNLQETVISSELNIINKYYSLLKDYNWSQGEKTEAKDWNFSVDFYGSEEKEELCKFYFSEHAVRVEYGNLDKKTVEYYSLENHSDLLLNLEDAYNLLIDQ